MKRKVALFITAMAVMALALAASALATPPSDHWTVSLNANPTTVAVGGTLTLSGELDNNGTQGVGNQEVVLSGFANDACTGDPYATQDITTSNANTTKGQYSFSGTVGLIPGTYSFSATADGHGTGKLAHSSCVVVTVTGSDSGGGDNGGAGWPGTTGTLDGNATGGCDSPVVLTSDETPPGYGAFNFDTTPGQTFSEIGLSFDFTVLSGTQAQSEPYFIVRFTDSTQAFVYSVDVNPGEPGEQTYSLTGNTYITRADAMEQWGDKVVSSVTLAVDNGNLSIQANGLSVDGSCGGGGDDEGGGGGPATVPAPYSPPNSIWLCYSKFQITPGDWLDAQAAELFAGGYWMPDAVAGNVKDGINVGAYHLVCNSGLKPTGGHVGEGGTVWGPDYTPWLFSDPIWLGFYPIVK